MKYTSNYIEKRNVRTFHLTRFVLLTERTARYIFMLPNEWPYMSHRIKHSHRAKHYFVDADQF